MNNEAHRFAPTWQTLLIDDLPVLWPEWWRWRFTTSTARVSSRTHTGNLKDSSFYFFYNGYIWRHLKINHFNVLIHWRKHAIKRTQTWISHLWVKNVVNKMNYFGQCYFLNFEAGDISEKGCLKKNTILSFGCYTFQPK